ncbi:UNVERIFIED_CONTAM: hypothetical protein Sradi_2509200 [Sesamum radiatum]|uniref:Uncharacterized protein n=1 Tax=Sesamum radiatum TaxID=300843 RepID=A0AAW2SKB2_SESRA
MSARITQKESRSYVEAVQHSKWREAMRYEIQALENNSTWKLAPLPVSKTPISCKWVFKT